MSGMQTIAEALAELKRSVNAPEMQYVEDWKAHIPSWSRWTPGSRAKPDCPICKGFEYLRVDVPVGHPMFGKMFLCECVTGSAAYAKAQTEPVRAASQLSEADYQLDWDSITVTPPMLKAMTAVRKTLRRGHGWVYLYGPPGPGKTLLAKTAVVDYLSRGNGAVFVLWADMLNHIRRGIQAGDYEARLQQWRNVPLLAIDEYGRAANSAWVDEIRNQIFTVRYESAIEKKTITLFTSNFSPDSVGNDDVGWLSDRLHDGRFNVLDRDDSFGGIVEMAAPSMRPAMSYTYEREARED